MDSLGKEVDKLESKISSIHGFVGLIDQTVELGKNMKDNQRANEQFNESYDLIIGSMVDIINLDISNANKMEALQEARVSMLGEELNARRDIINLQLRQKELDVKGYMSEARAEYWKDIDNQWIGRKSFFDQWFTPSFNTLDKDLKEMGKKAYNQYFAFEDFMREKVEPLLGQIPKLGEDATDEQLEEFRKSRKEFIYKVGNVEHELLMLVDSAQSDLEDINEVVIKNINKKPKEIAQIYLESIYGAERKIKPTKEQISATEQAQREILTYLGNSEAIGLYIEDYLQALKSTDYDVTSSYTKKVSQALKDLANETSQVITDRTKDIIDKFLGLLSGEGVSAETRYDDKLEDIRREIEKIKNRKNQILNDTYIVLSDLADELSVLGEVSTLTKKKPLTIKDTVENARQAIEAYQLFVDMMNQQSGIDSGDATRWVERLSKRLSGSPDPRIKNLGENLVNIIDSLVPELMQQIQASFTENVRYAVKNAKSDEERIEIYSQVLAIYDELMGNLTGETSNWLERIKNATLYELEEIINDIEPPDLAKDLAKFGLDMERKKLADTVRLLFPAYKDLLTNMEGHLSDFADIFQYVKNKLKPLGLDMSDFRKMISAVLKKDEEALSKIIGSLEGYSLEDIENLVVLVF